MELLNLLLALALPTALGTLIVSLLYRSRAPGWLTLSLGGGIFVGFIITAFMLVVIDALGIPLTFVYAALPMACWLLAGVFAYLYTGVGTAVRAHDGLAAPVPPRAQLLLFLFFLVLIDMRILTLALELVWRPLFPWDATMHWATKSKVWFESQSIVPFVDHQQWLSQAGKGVYTDFHADYPITIPLLQVWMSLALGRWDESLMNLPWLLCFVGLALMFYGQSRVAGSSALTAVVFTYLLVSLPLLNIHVGLAGYADMFVASFYCAALMAFHNWSTSGDRGQAALAAIFALSLPFMKNEGFFWSLTLLPALVVVHLTWRKSIRWLVGSAVALVLLLIFLPRDLVIAGTSLETLNLAFRPGGIEAMAVSIWMQDNWHLLGYMIPVLAALLIYLRRSAITQFRGIGVALLSAIVLLLVLFFYTRFAGGALNYSGVGRISMQLVPGLMYLTLLFWLAIVDANTRGGFRREF